MATPRPVDGKGKNMPVQSAGPQYRHMGLKVHYTFDKDARIHCLARHPQVLNLQVINIDEKITIGIVDLRACLDAIIGCSPELTTGHCDYTIYTVDYSEPDTPLVGQGLLSWALDSMQPGAAHTPPKLVIGRVAPSLLVFNAGSPETLEVRVRFFESLQIQRHASVDCQQCRPVDGPTEKTQAGFPSTPSAASDWNHVDTQPEQADCESRAPSRAQSLDPVPQGSSPKPSGSSAPLEPSLASQPTVAPEPSPTDSQPNVAPTPTYDHQVPPIAPTPTELPDEETNAPDPPSRPSSQASNRTTRKRSATVRPRGRPRKTTTGGNTSGLDEATEGEEGPTKKRAKTTKADKSVARPFASEPGSLRVAASTSSSLRNFRPVASTGEGATAGHPQEVPRAPTPVPQGEPAVGPPLREPVQSKLRQQSAPVQQPASAFYSDSRLQPLSPSQEDRRSPESLGPTPAYSEDSISSSPPGQRATPFMRSSPPPSSPVLPPMPSAEPQNDDSSFAIDDDMEDLFGEEPPRQPPPRVTTSTNSVRLAKSDPKMTRGIPIQVFQMQGGPGDQDMVHFCSYNGAPVPSSDPPEHQPSAVSDSLSLPVLAKDPGQEQARTRPLMEPTPPPTTDSSEKPTSPGHSTGPVLHGAQPDPATAAAIAHADISNTDSSLEEIDVDKPTMQRPPLVQPIIRRHIQASKAPSFRPLVRSQSAGAMPLALPSAPASEPVGPSSLSQSVTAGARHPAASVAPEQRRAASSGPLILPMPASDPVGPSAQVEETEQRCEAAAPSSPAPERFNKNRVKKRAIKQRLEEAIQNGEMPPFCSNCGAIETPTWRKIWVQDHDGTPSYCEYSEKPGKVTAIEILTRDADENPLSYRLVKKSLGAADDKSAWQELLLCNPCGIWLTKCKCHRPPDRWDKDLLRVGQERRRKATGVANPRPRKSRSKSEAAANPTSDAHPTTDALGIIEEPSHKAAGAELSVEDTEQQSEVAPEARPPSGDVGSKSGPSQTRGSGSATSPVQLDFDEAVGTTKRLLFPSPRKDGVTKVLGEVEVNRVQASDDSQPPKRHADDKENDTGGDEDGAKDVAGVTEVPQWPLGERPSTPPPGASAKTTSPFKTPTRAPSSHRPVTRSVSRSLRSNRSAASPGQVHLQQTPTKTPRNPSGAQGSPSARHSPHTHHDAFEGCDTPISRTISQMFSDPANFGLPDDMDLVTLPALDGDASNLIDFGNLMSTDGLMAPSSPLRGDSTGFDYLNSANMWTQWNLEETPAEGQMSEG
ncbi:hypothetical protein L249_2078 [Ophiocordyceps polyrhachis-furcata BCC 54312]|uniref:Ams2/SPT21 N-terminal domain-containing protein n=1 Tax=Ophiocordyceps polyrhachis-furcata BCC 54312 TaxID=1330021 RepID=A0A367LNP8_9HYPO|nr:hypothetical protein L249_2078 [Ophiocordyceps polyrhachis-furcata BCC 54312]